MESRGTTITTGVGACMIDEQASRLSRSGAQPRRGPDARGRGSIEQLCGFSATSGLMTRIASCSSGRPRGRDVRLVRSTLCILG
ncbi:hypothetical protein OH77DRAFT_223684 [Trametes cingulata]|nr:hypothetical protein OH77DRAFT_223684 [Trametes cingulata]